MQHQSPSIDYPECWGFLCTPSIGDVSRGVSVVISLTAYYKRMRFL